MPRRNGHILYDASCGFCRRWIPFWALTLKRHGFDIAPLQSSWARQRLSISSANLLDDLRLLLPDGNHIQGANVYRYVMRCIWWAWPIFLLSITPLFRQLFDRSYRAFATHRFRISAALGLDRCPTSPLND